MPHRDPTLKKFRIAVYILYGLIVAWVIVPFVIGAGRGVYSQEGKDRLAAGRAANALCAAAVNAPARAVPAACPKEAPPGNPEALLAQSRSFIAEIADPAMHDRVMKTLLDMELLVRGVNDPQAAKRVSNTLGDFLN